MFFRIKREYDKEVNYYELEKIRKTNPNCILLDVRNRKEYNEGHLKGAINIPLFEIKTEKSFINIGKNNVIIVYCQTGIRSKKAIKILERNGYSNLYNLKDGLNGV